MPYSSVPHYLPDRGMSRSCPVCYAPVINLQDKIRSIAKCITCGYAEQVAGDISDQHYYSNPVTAFTKRNLVRKAYYDLVDNVESSLYNILIEAGWDKNEAVSSIVRDLNLKDEQVNLFLRKVNDLE